VSSHLLSRRAASALATVALAVVPLVTLSACASSGSSAVATTPPPPVRRTAGDSTSVPDGDGKTLENLFAGRFPGVSVTPADGGGLRIRIRGGSNSFYAGDEPLFIIDGTPLPQGTGGVVHLNPYDIQKIEVLKNASDTALYGVRGANGVIKITTRRPGGR
jgi:TonB-dependent SusC/RagA subfamily outer membrane receptor